MATNELAKLASAVERQTTADGVYDTAVPGLTLYRSSAPSDHDAAVYGPCLVIVAQGSKEVQFASRILIGNNGWYWLLS